MVKTLWIVNTDINSYFINPFTNESLRQSTKEHQEFIGKVRKQYSLFALPYLALFPQGTYFIPESIRPVYGSMGNLQRLTEPLDEFIDKLLIGNETLHSGQQTPITAVVEFSATELYPEAINRLESKYEIKKVIID